ncbi:MAG TPA: ATP-binding protein [Devosiaceae bacterium]|nr:ATP-binding protein [Devosiaceae bacterium]
MTQELDQAMVTPVPANKARAPKLRLARTRWSLPSKVPPRAVLIFLPLALIAGLVFHLLYTIQLSATQRVIAAGQNQLVQVGYTAFASTLATIANDAQFIASEPMLERWLSTRDSGDRQILLAQYYSFVAHRAIYDQVRFIGLDGREQLRVDWNSGKPQVVRDDKLQNKADRAYVTQTLKLNVGQVYLSPLDLNVENGVLEQPIKPTLRVGAPIFDSDGRERGLIVLNYLAQRSLDRVQRLATEGQGDAWLVDANGYWLLGPSPSQEWGFMFPERKNDSFARDFPGAWKKIASSTNSGQFSVDGNLFTYAPIFQPNGDLPDEDLTPGSTMPSWFLVTRTTASAVSAANQTLMQGYLIALSVVVLLLAGIAWIIAHHTVKRREAEQQVFGLNEQLARDNAALETANRELESFSYSVSHDLRAPLRSIDGFSQALLEDYADSLDAGGQDYLMRVRNAAQRMGHLIDDLIKLARVTRSELTTDDVDLSEIARRILADLQRRDPQRAVEIVIGAKAPVQGDAHLLNIALQNLLENAWKFTAKRAVAVIEFGETEQDGKPVYFVRDNGAGFEMAHVGKLFGVFQRLHAVSDFEGTGIGLATVQRIVYKHGGRVWAEAERDRGATFYFVLREGGKAAA